jgi:hypothetical protein
MAIVAENKFRPAVDEHHASFGARDLLASKDQPGNIARASASRKASIGVIGNALVCTDLLPE